MICTLCHKPIELVPSAAERAKKFGGKPSDYTRLFTEHSACILAKRTADIAELIQWSPIPDTEESEFERARR